MWKYISGVPKVVEEEKKEKNPKAACDSKEYDKNGTRKFSAKWQVGQVKTIPDKYILRVTHPNGECSQN